MLFSCDVMDIAYFSKTQYACLLAEVSLFILALLQPLPPKYVYMYTAIKHNFCSNTCYSLSS